MNTPLHMVLWGGHFEAVEFLLEHESDVNAQNDLNNTPLHLASLCGQLKAMRVFLGHGADLQ
jgi:ankyrin repeat protein